MQQGPLGQLFADWYAVTGYQPAQQPGPTHHRQLLALLAEAAVNATASAGSSGDAVSAAAAAMLHALQPGSSGGSSSMSADLSWLSKPPPGDDPSGPAQISLLGLLLAACLIAVNGAISLWLRLGLHTKLGVATIRCILQLSLLGYILVPIFTTNAWWLTALYSLFMLLVAAIEAVSRPSRTYAGMLPQVLATLGISSSLVISYGLAVVVQVHPWWDAQYLIPMLGMLLGNACSGVAVGLSTILDELSSGRDKIEQLLSFGASRWEATREVVQRASRMALTPLLNTMNVVGIVSIPGMMTGQILGGSDPATAARYQIIIMFLIAASTGLSAVASVYAAVFSVVDDCHRLRSDRLIASGGAAKGAVAWIGAQLAAGWRGARSRAGRGLARIRLAFGYVARQRHRYFRWRGEQEGRGEEMALEAEEEGRLGGSPASPASPRRPLLGSSTP